MKVDLPYIVKLPPLLVIFGMFAFIIIPFLIWASLTKIDQLARAQGVVIASAKTQQIQSANDGVIKDIYIKEGDIVKKDDKIITLEVEQFQAGYESTESKVASLKATINRLESEIYDKELIFDELVLKYPDFIETQKELFYKKQKALNDQIKVLNSSLSLAKEELELNLPLIETGDIGSIEVLRLQRQVAEIEGNIINTKNKYFQESQSELTKAQEELSIKEQELIDKQVSLQRTTIYAPVDAKVNNILITTKGAKVRSGDVILELVPDNDELIIEAKLQPADLSFIKVGQKAIIKLDSYDFSIFGAFEGKVKHISPDNLIEKTPQGEKYYFRVLISIDSHELISKVGKKVTITTGMTNQVEIITGERTVLNYLTKPLIKTVSEAFSER